MSDIPTKEVVMYVGKAHYSSLDLAATRQERDQLRVELAALQAASNALLKACDDSASCGCYGGACGCGYHAAIECVRAALAGVNTLSTKQM